MRSSVAILLGIVIMVVGVFGISQAGQDVKDQAVTNGTNATQDAYNVSTEVFGGLSEAAAPGVIWFGVAAIVVIALGYLVVAGKSGR